MPTPRLLTAPSAVVAWLDTAALLFTGSPLAQAAVGVPFPTCRRR
jgi:hypothetical protein